MRKLSAARRLAAPWPLVLLALLVLLLAACGEAQPADETDQADESPADGEPEDPEAGEPGAGEPRAGEPDTEDAAEEAPEDAEGPLTVYSGRNEELVGPILEQFTEDTGIETEVRYGDTAELAATILEEGENSPADVYFAQDAGALGALTNEGMLTTLPDASLEPVEERFRATDGTWVGISGRARTMVYSTEFLSEDDLPDSILDLADDEWSGRIGWAPTNGSFQAFVTAMRVELGDEATRAWLEGMVDNDPAVYENNVAQVEAASRGEIEIGLVNHYYLPRFLEENPDAAAAQKFLEGGDIGALVNVAGVGIVGTTDQPSASQELVDYLLTEDAQRYFADETYEYPLVAGMEADPQFPPLDEIETPELDLSDLDDLQGTLEMLQEVGALQ